MLQWVGTNTSPFNKAKNLMMYDCRPKINAMANVCKGGGWESEENYNYSVLEFLNIANIHVVRESFINLRQLFQKLPAVKQLNSHAENRYRPIVQALTTGKDSWYEHLKSIMTGANKIVDTMSIRTTSVLIHCR